jgi:alpha-tubulin suppressor-like RCC1 family protein
MNYLALRVLWGLRYVAIVALLALSGCDRNQGIHSSNADGALLNDRASLMDHLSGDMGPPDEGLTKDRVALVDHVVQESGNFPREDVIEAGFDAADIPVMQDAGGPGATYDGSNSQVIAGCGPTCTIRRNGDVYCWGYSVYFGTGAGTEDLRPRRIGGLHNIVQLANDCYSACAVDHNRDVWCWGANPTNVLQTGSNEEILLNARRRMDVSGIEQVAQLGYAFFARRVDGSIFVQNRPSIFTFSPSAPTIDLRAASAGYCVVLSTGQLLCDEQGATPRGPQPVVGLDNVIAATVGPKHICALKRDGTVWCWGNNEVGQTGFPLEMSDICESGRLSHPLLGYVYPRYYCVRQPRQVQGLTDVVEISAGAWHTCARRRDQTVWCWGANQSPFMTDSGQGIIGDGLPNTERCPSAPWIPESQTPGARQCRRRPSRVAGLMGTTSIAVGSDYACAVLSSDQVWCWGSGEFASLGDGTGRSSTAPVQVPLPGLPRDE